MYRIGGQADGTNGQSDPEYADYFTAGCRENNDAPRYGAAAFEQGYDAIHDTVHEMAKDEARHGKGFEGLLKRYFG